MVINDNLIINNDNYHNHWSKMIIYEYLWSFMGVFATFGEGSQIRFKVNLMNTSWKSMISSVSLHFKTFWQLYQVVCIHFKTFWCLFMMKCVLYMHFEVLPHKFRIAILMITRLTRDQKSLIFLVVYNL